MKTFRAWFTPGSVVATACVALLWLHHFAFSPINREALQIVLICLAFAGLWVLAPHGRSDT